MKRIPAFLAGLAMVLVLLCGCQEAEAAPSAVSTSQPFEAGQSLPEAEALGEDVFSFKVELQGQVYKLPESLGRFLQNGWGGAGLENLQVPPGQILELALGRAGEKIGLVLENKGPQPSGVLDCPVTGVFTLDSEAGETLRLPGGLGLGSEKAAVLAACGLPSRSEEPAGDLLYSFSPNAYIAFDLQGTEAVRRLRVMNGGYQEDPRLEQAVLPAPVQAYSPPEELPQSWASGTVRYGNRLYTLPAPVDAFLASGWKLRDTRQAMVPPGGWRMGVQLQLGGQVLRTCVYNYSETEQPVAGCFVTKIESNPLGADVSLELPGGITRQSAWESVLAAYGEPAIVYKNIQGRYMTYGSAENGVQFQLDREEDRIVAITVRFEQWQP